MQEEKIVEEIKNLHGEDAAVEAEEYMEKVKEISVEGQEEVKEEIRIYPKKGCTVCCSKGFARFYNNVNPNKHTKGEFEQEIRPCGCVIGKATDHYRKTKEEMFPVEDEGGKMYLSNIKSEIEEPLSGATTSGLDLVEQALQEVEDEKRQKV